MKEIDLKKMQSKSVINEIEVDKDSVYKFTQDISSLETAENLNLKFNFTVPDTKSLIDIRYVVRNFTIKPEKRDKTRSELKLTVKVVMKAPKSILGTQSNLMIRVINLSSKANILIEPVLEIEEKNIDMDHKVTIGGIDHRQIHYFESRGIPRSTAKKLIVNGFLNG
ncbi:hypothetical protein GF357_05185 [Candidatus Dojkabacteria bacterium]|nr:hypothetical protein [Candidatus Dojkabacteria bacterium]